MYEAVFRPAVGKKFDEMEQEIWVEIARQSRDIARSLRLPVRPAQDLAESIGIVMTILFGPEFKWEVMDVGKDGAVIIIKNCPFVAEAAGMGGSGESAFRRCLALTISTQKNLNPKYALRYVRALCMGDRQCEIKIEPEQEPEKVQDAKKLKI
jgi:hypothetical protein